MHVDDIASACLYFLENHQSPNFINVGWGSDVSIKELAQLIGSIVGFKGEIVWDTSKPDGMPRKCMDVTQMENLGFRPKITLEEGIKKTIKEYKQLKLNIRL
jgi:GDP-L-fucose synthase